VLTVGVSHHEHGLCVIRRIRRTLALAFEPFPQLIASTRHAARVIDTSF